MLVAVFSSLMRAPYMYDFIGILFGCIIIILLYRFMGYIWLFHSKVRFTIMSKHVDSIYAKFLFDQTIFLASY